MTFDYLPEVMLLFLLTGAAALSVLWFGVKAVRSSDSDAATHSEGVSRVFCIVLIFVGLDNLVPTCKKVFDDFEMVLPAVTQALIYISNLFVKHCEPVMLLLVIGFAGEVWLFDRVHREPGSRSGARRISASITTFYVLASLLCLLALLLPFIEFVISL